MAPNFTSEAAALGEADAAKGAPAKEPQYKWRIVWLNVILYSILHSSGVYGTWLGIMYAKRLTIIWVLSYGFLGGMGITAGVHRLWAHRAYKAKWPLRLLLAFGNTIAFQDSIYTWARDHRVHHKNSETDADPHNANRGFFFSHVGWLLMKKLPQVVQKGNELDLSDLLEDPIVVWQKRLYPVIVPVFCFLFPAWVPVYFWGEDPWISWFFCALSRYATSLHVTWLVNSAAHIWGAKPYDKAIRPAENLPVTILTFGEGWHNYHHVFPWDYRASELANFRLNITTAFIDFFAWLGWAYDLKTVPEEMVLDRAGKTGDGSHAFLKHNRVRAGVWGWGDVDMPPEDVRDAAVLKPTKTD